MTALVENRIFYDREGSSSTHRHWVVTQASGETCDVWVVFDFGKGIRKWSCNAVGLPDKKGERHGCVFYNGDQTEPYCSHTLGAFFCRS